MCGTEYFGHPWEFGPRKAKELLLTGDALGVDEAHQLGMVSKVFPRETLEEQTLNFARRIAGLPTMTALLIKEAVNQTVDTMGFYNALQSCFTLHQLNHAHWAEVHEDRLPIAAPEDGVGDWRTAPPITLAERDTVVASSPARQATAARLASRSATQ
jgi:enoyl-CoA hydratase